MVRTALLTLSVAAAVVMAALSGPAAGDDTDIYINPSRPPTEQPMVMFSLDYRPNLTSSAASNVEQFFRDAGLGADVDELKAISGNLVYFDTLILSLKLALSEISGVKIGFMLNHNAGGIAGYKGEAPTSSNKDSNGGVILMGFRTLDDPNTLVEFKRKLIALKKLKPQSNSPDHIYQGSELFFEFYRYLTGQAVYNGHNGWLDFEAGNSKDTSTNMRCTDLDSTINPACWDPAIESPNPLSSTNPASTPPAYLSPFSGIGACARVFTVNFLFQVSQQEAESESAMFLPGGTKASGGLDIAKPSTQNDYFTTTLAFLRDADLADGTFGSAPALAGNQNVTSYFVVEPSKVNNTTIGYAKAGGTETPLELATDPQQLVDTLRNIFKQILSVSTTFVAASVPVNVFNRAEIVDNVYFALFQAEANARWKGNLKKLKLEAVDVTDESGNVVGQRARIIDNQSTPKDAIGADGRILFDALSHWTDNTGTLLDAGDSNGDGIVDAKDTNNNGVADNVDTTTGQVTFPTPTSGTAANLPNYITDRDGRHIPRGGAGHKIPGFASGSPGDANPTGVPPASGPRKLLYLSAGTSSASLQPLNVYAAGTQLNELKAQLGNASMTDTDAQNLLRYARGQDITDIDGDTNLTETRHWVLGDPLHSRPLPVNYGAITVGTGGDAQAYTASNPAIFIAMASNDGYLRMMRNTNVTGTLESGQEVWAFMPPEGLTIQNALKTNATNNIPKHPYSFDGEPTALVMDQDGDGNIESGDKVILYVGLRRGGSAYYALDITDPLNPVFLWRIAPGSRTTASGVASTPDFNEMGLSFSRPRVGAVQIGTNTDGSIQRRLAVFFGGGYYGGHELDVNGNPTATRIGNDVDGTMADDSIGNALFMVRASDSTLMWKAVGGTGAPTSTVFEHAQLRDSVPSNVSLADTNADGAIDRVIFGDTGGNVWRADLGPTAKKLTRVACVGRHGGTDCADITTRINDRRFFHEPDLVQARDSVGRFDAIVIGSGDREDPLDQGGDVDNYIYMIKDRNVEIGAGADSTVDQADLTDVTNLCTSDSTGTCSIGNNGWKLLLDSPNGEKALSAPLTIANSIFFTTYLPPSSSSNTCGPGEGSGFVYAINLFDASPVHNYDTTDPEKTKDDRRSSLETPGIPAQVVYLGSPGALAGAGAGGGTGSCTVNILAGARILDVPGCPRFRTFWQRFEKK